MKLIPALTLAAALAFSATACSSDADAPKPTDSNGVVIDSKDAPKMSKVQVERLAYEHNKLIAPNLTRERSYTTSCSDVTLVVGNPVSCMVTYAGDNHGYEMHGAVVDRNGVPTIAWGPDAG